MGGGYRGAPYKKNGGKNKNKKNSVQGVRGAAVGGVLGGAPIKKMGVQIFFPQLSRGPEGSSRWPKATSPPQELEVGARRVPYCHTF